jgi:hypothetical protein
MKIYTKLVLDMSTLEVLEEESFEYDGPLALCEGDSDGGAESDGGVEGDPGGIGGVGAEGPEGMGGNESEAEGGAGSDFGGSDPGGIGGVGAEGPEGMGPGSDMGGSEFGGAQFGDFEQGYGANMGNFAGPGFGEAQSNVGGPGGMGEGSGGPGTAQYSDRTNWSEVSVGRDMAAARAEAAAQAKGLSPGQVAEAVGRAVSDYGDRNPAAVMSLADLKEYMAQSKVGQAYQGLMDKAKGMFGKDKEEQGFMAGMPDQKGGFAGVEFGDFGVGPNFAGQFAQSMSAAQDKANTLSDRASSVFEAHNKARSFAALSPFSKKMAGKVEKGLIDYGIMSHLGVPSSVAKDMALTSVMANPLSAMVAPAYSAISANYSTQVNLAEIAAEVSHANPDLSDKEVAEAVQEMSVDAGHEVEMGAIENAMADEWGGDPEGPGAEGGDAASVESVGAGPGSTEGGEQGLMDDYMYDMSPLKNYWQANYGAGAPGFMGGGVYDGQSRAGVYGFRK